MLDQPADMRLILVLAKGHPIQVIEDVGKTVLTGVVQFTEPLVHRSLVLSYFRRTGFENIG